MDRKTALSIMALGILLAVCETDALADRDYRNPQGEWVGGPHPFSDRDKVVKDGGTEEQGGRESKDKPEAKTSVSNGIDERAGRHKPSRPR